MSTQETPAVLIWLLSGLLGIILGCFLSADDIYVACDWTPLCSRLCTVGLRIIGGITLFACLLLTLPCTPETGTDEPEEGTEE